MSNVGRRMPPTTLVDLSDDLAVEVSTVLRKRGMRLCDLRQYGYSDRSRDRISAWLRATPEGGEFSIEASIRLAERLNIPIRILVGDEAREVA